LVGYSRGICHFNSVKIPLKAANSKPSGRFRPGQADQRPRRHGPYPTISRSI